MRQGKDVVGMSVVSRDSGLEVGRVKDLIVHRDTNRVVGLLMRQGGWFQHASVLPLSKVLSFGSNTIMVLSENAVVDPERVPDIQRLLTQKKLLGETTLVTANGNEVGRVKDVRFDEHSGRVEGFEVLTSIFIDAVTSSRTFLPADRNVVVGEDAVLVTDELAERLMQLAEGVEALNQITDDNTSNPADVVAREFDFDFAAASAKVRSIWKVVCDRLREGTQFVIAKIRDIWGRANQKTSDQDVQVSSPTKGRRTPNALGRPVSSLMKKP